MTPRDAYAELHLYLSAHAASLTPMQRDAMEAALQALKEREQLREIVQAVAEGATVHRHRVELDPTDPEVSAPSYFWMCADCGCALSTDRDPPQTRQEAVTRIRHTPACSVTKARQLLKK